MTDLVDRLLADADAWDPPDAPGAAPHDGPEVACLEREGAAEIKRLRAALEDIASRESEARDIVKQNRWPSTLAIDMAGMAAMTLANAYTGDTSGNAFFRLRAEIDHLRAEVERLTREKADLLDAMKKLGDDNRVLCASRSRLEAALATLLDEQNDAPLERRRKQWAAACQQAREALGR